MSDTITCCPSCSTSFPVTQAQLKMAGGVVRCGVCSTTFDTRCSSNTAPHEITAQDRKSHPPAESMAIHIPNDLNFDHIALPPPKKSERHWAAKLLLLLLIGSGALQLAYFNSDRLYQHPDYGHLITALCQHTGCPMPAQVDLDAIEVINLHVYSHNNIANALIAEASINNTAPFAQPFPSLLLQFANLQGKVINERIFKAHNYLHNEQINKNLFPANSAIHIKLAIVDPGPLTTSYTLLVVK